jgi:hypothetical protein
VDLLAKVLLYQVGSTRVSTRFSTVQSKSSALIPRTSRSQAIGIAICNCASISIFLSAAPPVLRLGHPAFRLTSLGCVWFAFLSEPDPRGAGERRLIACTAPRVRDAFSSLLPASSETPETTVSAKTGSAHAAVSLANDILVYN